MAKFKSVTKSLIKQGRGYLRYDRTLQVGASGSARCHYLLASPRKPLPEPLPEARPRRGKPRPAQSRWTGAAASAAGLPPERLQAASPQVEPQDRAQSCRSGSGAAPDAEPAASLSPELPRMPSLQSEAKHSMRHAATPAENQLSEPFTTAVKQSEMTNRPPKAPASSACGTAAASELPRPVHTANSQGEADQDQRPLTNGQAGGCRQQLPVRSPASERNQWAATGACQQLPGTSTAGEVEQGAAAGEVLWEVVVPVSTSCSALTPRRLQHLLRIPSAAGLPMGGGHLGIVLAMVDRDGTVGFSRLHADLVPPAEGPPPVPT